MKKYIFLTLFLLADFGYAGTRDVVPREDAAGALGTASKRWTDMHTVSGTINNLWVDSINAPNVITSTALLSARLDAVAVGTGIINTNFTASTQNITTRADAVAITTTSLDSATQTLNIRLDEVAVATGVVYNNFDISTQAITTRADFVAVATAIFAARAMPYRIVIGTSPTWGANVIGNTQNVFTAAISSAGNSGTIFVQRGSYTFTSMVNSIGVSSNSQLTFLFEEGAILSNNSSINFFTLENTKLINPTFNIKSFAGAANVIEMKYNSTVDKAHFPNLRLQGNNAVFHTVDSSYNWITNCDIADGDMGASAYWMASIDGSNNVYIRDCYFDIQKTKNASVIGVIIQGGKDIYYGNNFMKTNGGNTVYLDNSAGKATGNLVIRGNTFDVELAATAVNGSLWIANGSGSDIGCSTGAIIIDSNIFKLRSSPGGTGSTKAAISFYTAGNPMDSMVVSNNIFVATEPVIALACRVQSALISSTTFTDNKTINISNFIADAGAGTNYLNNGNTANGIPIGNIHSSSVGVYIDSATFYGTITSTNGFIVGSSTITNNLKVTGSIGIGTVTPTIPLEIYDLSGTTAGTFKMTFANNGDASKINILRIGAKTGYSGIVLDSGNSYSGNFSLIGGNVGIGTTNPGARLSLGALVADRVLDIYDGGSSQAGFGIASGLLRMHLYSASNRFGIYSSPVATTELFTVTGLGNVGIGTTNPSSKLDVFNGSITVRGTNAGIISSGDICSSGTFRGNRVDVSTFIGRREMRYLALVDATSITPDVSVYEYNYQINTQGIGTLTVNAPTGTPCPFLLLGIRIKSTNVQTFSWNAIYRDPTGAALPTATTGGGATNYYWFVWNDNDQFYDLTRSK